jgi:hypothetical protein
MDLHKAVAGMLDWRLLRPAYYTTFPSGWDKMTPAMAGRLKGCGLKKGMPDILVFHGGRTVGIELKVPNGAGPTAAQRETHSNLHAAGIKVFVCRSVDAVIETLLSEGFPIRPDRGFTSYAADAPIHI